MDQQPRLSQLIAEGWKVQLAGLSTIQDAPLPQELISEIRSKCGEKATHVVRLVSRDFNDYLWFVITSKSELLLAEEQLLLSNKIIGYELRITCGGRNSDGEVRSGPFAQFVKNVTGWNVKANEGEKTFDVFFSISGSDKSEGESRIHDLEDVLIALSFKNKTFFEIWNIAWGPMYVAQPFAAWHGRPENVPRIISESDVAKVRRLRKSDNQDLLFNLTRFFGQGTPAAKVLYGFSILEDLYRSKAEHALTTEEIKLVLDQIEELQSIDDLKRKKLSTVIKNSDYVCKKNRNERMAVGVAKDLGITEEEAYRQLKELSALRGRLAHSNTVDPSMTADALALINKIIDHHFLMD